jgi:tetratricopeptide (TPR) repeat protein
MNARTFTFFALAVLLLLAGKPAQANSKDAEATRAGTLTEAAASLQQPPRYGKDSVTCVRNWSLYNEYYRQRNFHMAIEPWRWMFFNCPAATQNIYIHGSVLVKYMYNQETDPANREALVDTLMMVHDQRIEYFGREGYVLGRKVADLYQFRTNNVQDQHDISERSIELEGLDSQGDVLLINFQSTVRLAEAGLLDPTKVVESYDRAIDIIEYNLVHNPQDSTRYATAKNNIEILFEPFASCDNLARIFGPRYKANPEDPELLARITEMLEKSGCTDSELFYMATKSLHRLRPTAQSAFLMGRLESSQENHAQALKYYEESIELYEQDDSENYTDEKFRTYLLMADIAYRIQRRMPQARTYALAATQVKPDDGRPYILIGEMYAASASDCGDDEFTKTAAYWAAVDKFIQARDVDSDPQISERATQFIRTYSQYFPNNELIFFYGHAEGETYRVGCWINETTRIRAR